MHMYWYINIYLIHTYTYTHITYIHIYIHIQIKKCGTSRFAALNCSPLCWTDFSCVLFEKFAKFTEKNNQFHRKILWKFRKIALFAKKKLNSYWPFSGFLCDSNTVLYTYTHKDVHMSTCTYYTYAHNTTYTNRYTYRYRTGYIDTHKNTYRYS